MHVRMVQAEVEEAIREWLQKRGIDAPKNEIKFRVKVQLQGGHSRAYSNGELAEGPVLVDVSDIELPVKDGPYR
jgi:hypothetical protein